MRVNVHRVIGDRQADTPFEVAAWIVALWLLTLVLRTNQVLADSSFFFVAHDLSPRTLLLLWGAVTGLLLLLVTGVLYLTRRYAGERAFDVVGTAVTLTGAGFLLGNALGWFIGFAAAVVFTVVSRRVAFGKPLLVIAAVTAAVPLVFVSSGTQNEYAARVVTYDDTAQRPDVLWIITDAAQSQVLFTPDGEARSLFPNLRRLQQTSTTYTRGYATANHTPVSVASMLNGVAQVPLDRKAMAELERSPGIVSWLSPAYDVTVESDVFSDLCTSQECSQTRGRAGSPLEELTLLAADVTAVAGNTLQPPLSAAFPPLEGKWRDFWATQSADAGVAPSGIQDWLGGLATRERPQFALWHSLETHDPYDRDFNGERMFNERELMSTGAWFDLNGSFPSAGAERLARRLYLAGAVAFDRQIGETIDRLQAEGELDRLMLIITSDHGIAFSRGSHIRVGDDATMRWNEVAHVPLMVKYPGQTRPALQAQPRSTAQIARTVLDAGAVMVESGPALAPGLDVTSDQGPSFVTDLGLDEPILERLPSDLVVTDGWTRRDLEAPEEEFPFAVTDLDVVPGQALPDGWQPLTPRRIEPTQGTSPLQLLSVEVSEGQCPVADHRAVVTLDDEVVAQVVWEQTGRATPAMPRGWAVVPRARLGDYSFWCQPV